MSDYDIETVELHPAHCWTCPECGRDQFLRCCVPEMEVEDDEALEEFRDTYDIELPEDAMAEIAGGLCVLVPDYVVCEFCACEFPAEPQMQW